MLYVVLNLKIRLILCFIDIQEFYDNILLNERLPLLEKIKESQRFASIWEQRGVFHQPPFQVETKQGFNPSNSFFDTAPVNF